MPRLVLLSEGFTGRSHDLKAETTSVGRVDDNAFVIEDPSVSSHHAEIIFKSGNVLIRDLNSTNGTFIDGNQITEAPLKPGQTLQFGMIELRLETGPSTGPSAPTSAPSPAPAKKTIDHTLVMPQGVKLGQGDVGNNPQSPGMTTAFKKKSNRSNKIFMAVVIVALVAIAGIVIWALSKLS